MVNAPKKRNKTARLKAAFKAKQRKKNRRVARQLKKSRLGRHSSF